MNNINWRGNTTVAKSDAKIDSSSILHETVASSCEILVPLVISLNTADVHHTYRYVYDDVYSMISYIILQ